MIEGIFKPLEKMLEGWLVFVKKEEQITSALVQSFMFKQENKLIQQLVGN